jgi:arginyl-tRNA synthetase
MRMNDPMTDLCAVLSAAVSAAFEAEGLDRKFGQVRRSDRPDLAPFQCNGAMAAAKAAGRPPRAVADAVAARVGWLNPEVAGPGFVNLRPDDELLRQRGQTIFDDPRAGAALAGDPKTVVVDFAWVWPSNIQFAGPWTK